jgi:glycosyltransferase involved in cell wall biosynthesis
VLFNSHTHRRSFLEGMDRFLRRLPDARPLWALKRIQERSAVLYPGCRFAPPSPIPRLSEEKPPLVVWNHRWEHDKNPACFFRALEVLEYGGADYRLALLGERYELVPDAFGKALSRFAHRIETAEYIPSKSEYYGWLRRGSVVVSTAGQENFGVAVVEAVRHGCLPLLPRRLSYPEILPAYAHGTCLYDTEKALAQRLEAVVNRTDRFTDLRRRLAQDMGRHAWQRVVGAWDEELERLSRLKTALRRPRSGHN